MLPGRLRARLSEPPTVALSWPPDHWVRCRLGGRHHWGVTGGELIRVLVVDDHRMVREGLRSYLGLVDDIVMVGDASDGRGALDWLARAKAQGALPDVSRGSDRRRMRASRRDLGRPAGERRAGARGGGSGTDGLAAATQVGPAGAFPDVDITPEQLAKAERLLRVTTRGSYARGSRNCHSTTARTAP
jgi:hypothetical protein